MSNVAIQGDLYFVAIDALPKSAKPRQNRQLAEGSTKGSKHVVSGGEVYDADAIELAKAIQSATGKTIDPKYIGPVFVGPCTVEHPEHQHQVFSTSKPCVVVFQRNLDAEEREQRAID